ncbi:hypothetical protein Sjap_019807 [Stephania japonica]|uniref:Gag-pol polyprotein n=1 Tax=Stephania japonica TaxID=461633 RepID=A0AAP0HV26_9MAGN
MGYSGNHMITNQAPVLGRSNFYYDVWKPRMKVFIQSLGVITWRVVEEGWKEPTTIDADGNSVRKPYDLWTVEEQMLSVANATALNVIFCGVDYYCFTKIKTCVAAKEAWDTLETAYKNNNWYC